MGLAEGPSVRRHEVPIGMQSRWEFGVWPEKLFKKNMNAGNLEYVYLYFCERYRDEMVRLPDIQQTHPIHSLVDIPSFQGRGQLANAPSLPPFLRASHALVVLYTLCTLLFKSLFLCIANVLREQE